MLAGVAVLAVIAPAADFGDNRAEAAPPALSVPPASTPHFALELTAKQHVAAGPALRLNVGHPNVGELEILRLEASRISAVASRSASRPMARSPLAVRRLTRTVAARQAATQRSATQRSAAKRSAVGQAAKVRPGARVKTARSAAARSGATRSGTVRSTAARRPSGVERAGLHQVSKKRSVRHRWTSSRTRQNTVMRDRGRAAVVAYARSQVGKRYSSGGDGPNAFDCSGFTMQAYKRMGLRLPHSSGGQAARARNVSRSSAKPGDLVVGPGHVGIYMGDGMMIDAGNRRVGVVFRPLYSGLHVERLPR